MTGAQPVAANTIASERIGRETVTYVSNLYKYYVAYRLVVAQQEMEQAAKEKMISSKNKETE